MVIAVVAADKNGVIGRKNTIPWRIRDDLVRLKDLTKGKIVILGRNSYESMAHYYDKSGREMPGAVYLVMTRNENYKPARKNAKVVHSPKEAMIEALNRGDNPVYVIGGRAVWESMMPYLTDIYLTEVQAEVTGDTYFPKLEADEWKEVSREHHEKNERNEYDFDYIHLKKS